LKGEKKMKLVNIDYIPGKELEILDLVKGTTVYCKNFGKDFMAGMKTLVGGEIESYTEMLITARQIATKRMVDEAESLGADARDLCSVIDVSDCSELKLSYNGLLIGRIFHDRFYPKIKSFLQTVRNLRGDNSLLVYLLKNLLSKIEETHENDENFYGYYVLRCNVSARGKVKKYRYYLAKKKIHSGRFATDTHAAVFENMALKSNKGFKDFISYKSLRQTEEELAAQHSYFYNEMKEWK
jgi:uncharacterized protein YbjQ (UPF0145 family)